MLPGNVSANIPSDPEVILLQSQITPPGPQAWAACKALGLHPSNEALGVLVELARSPNWNYRHAATRAIATHRLGRSAKDILLALLKDKSPYVVRAACDAASQLQLQEAHDAILSLVHSVDASTRSSALDALATLWRQSDIDIVYRVFLDDSSSEVRRRAAWTLRATADQENWELLFKAWHADNLSRHRVWACELAEEFGGSNLYKELQPLLADVDGHVRKAANHAYEELVENAK